MNPALRQFCETAKSYSFDDLIAFHQRYIDEVGDEAPTRFLFEGKENVFAQFDTRATLVELRGEKFELKGAVLHVAELVTKLNLSGLTISQLALNQVAHTFPNVTKLHLDDCTLDRATLLAVSAFKKIEDLSLIGSHFDTDDLILLNTLTKFKSMTLLTLRGCMAFESPTSSHIREALAHLQKVKAAPNGDAVCPATQEPGEPTACTSVVQ